MRVNSSLSIRQLLRLLVSFVVCISKVFEVSVSQIAPADTLFSCVHFSTCVTLHTIVVARDLAIFDSCFFKQTRLSSTTRPTTRER